jgi:arginyl-tRNA synthetase
MVAQLESLLQKVAESLGYTYPKGVLIEEPPAHVKADFSVNIAMQLARETKQNPREIAENVRTKLLESHDISFVEIAGPGFLNINLGDSWYQPAVQRVVITPVEHPQKINVEYISANPSGPLHIGNARGGPIGETIARVLQRLGHTVERDFYLNDIGGQANKFAETVLHYYKLHFKVPSEFPEKGYPAPYVQELAEEIVRSEGDRFLQLKEEAQIEAMRVVAIERQVSKIRATAERMGIQFDRWYPQSELLESGRSQTTLEELQKKGATLEKDGAVWLKSGIQDDDRETVLVKSDGTTTYFLDDIAYYREKFTERGFARGVCLLGANHYGHIPRMEAAMVALGFPERYHGVMYQNVQLKVDGQNVKMAKREGNFVTADEVLDEIPRDVFTYFMLSKAAETHLDFDLQLAKDTSEKNPIYYIQYANARIHSILARAEKKDTPPPADYLYNVEERALIRHLVQFDTVVQEVGENYRTHLIPAYLYELASRYHHFYAHHRVITEDESTTALRLRLSILTAETIKEGLSLLNIVAQEKM